jgi:hypothetical protein
MAWRPHERERRLAPLPGVHRRLHGRARRKQRDRVRLGRGERVGVQHDGASCRVRNLIDVRWTVCAGDLVTVSRLRLG